MMSTFLTQITSPTHHARDVVAVQSRQVLDEIVSDLPNTEIHVPLALKLVNVRESPPALKPIDNLSDNVLLA